MDIIHSLHFAVSLACSGSLGYSIGSCGRDRFSVAGQLDTAIPTAEQATSKQGLDPFHLLADRGLRGAERSGGPAEAARFDDPQEHLDLRGLDKRCCAVGHSIDELGLGECWLGHGMTR